MPGVPSGKGCNTCRKQKKKCDWRGSTCSRCKRLQIQCIGGGQQRYKFMIQTHEVAVQKTSNKLLMLSEMVERCRAANNYSYPINVIPSNRYSRLVDSFLDKLNPELGVQYHLAWTFGDYVAEVPCRLGTNPALDAAAEAVVVSYSTFTDRPNRRGLVLWKYNDAISKLRMCLDDPTLASSPETLCAVMLLLICQMFTGDYQAHANHADGAASIVRMRGKDRPDDPFAEKLLLTLTGPLVFQALFTDTVSLNDEEWLDLFDSALTSPNPVGIAMSCLSRVWVLMKRIKRALAVNDQAELALIREESLVLKERIRQPLKFLQDQLDLLNEPAELAKKQTPVIKDLFICTFIRLRALGLTISILIDKVHCAVTNDPEIMKQIQVDAREMLDLGRSARRFRPLGAASLPLSLEVAWTVLDDEELKAEIDIIHRDFASDFWEKPYKDSATVFEKARGCGLLYTFDKPNLSGGTLLASGVSPDDQVDYFSQSHRM